MGDSLDPTPLHRLTAALRPDWSRTVLARRIAAGVLVVLAALIAVRSDPRGDHMDIVVAARDLPPGQALSAEDVRIENRSAATVPEGAQRDSAAVIGKTLAGPTRRGEVLTDIRLLGPRLAEAAAGPNARIVPLHLADTALLDLVRPGDVVDVLAAPDSGSTAGDGAESRLVAGEAVVVLVSEKQQGPGAGERVVLVALPAHDANEVAGAALVQTVTLTFH